MWLFCLFPPYTHNLLNSEIYKASPREHSAPSEHNGTKFLTYFKVQKNKL
jgi:hypothetical protein